MSNEESRNLKDTRGRPRAEDTSEIADKVQSAYMRNRLPLTLCVKEPKKLAKRLRLSQSFIEMQEEIGTHIRILAGEGELIFCLGRK